MNSCMNMHKNGFAIPRALKIVFQREHSFVHSIVFSFVHSCVHSLIHSCIQSRTHLCLHSCIHLCTRAFIRAFLELTLDHNNKYELLTSSANKHVFQMPLLQR